MEAQENSQTEQNAQAPKKRELALVSRSTYIKEKALQWIFFACAFLAVVTVILIFVFTTYSALPVFTDIGLADFFSFTWAPSEGHYGIVSLLGRLGSGDRRCARHGCAPRCGHGRVSGRDRRQARAQAHQPCR